MKREIRKKQCPVCGDWWMPKDYKQVKYKITCSKKCSYIRIRQTRKTGDENPVNWRTRYYTLKSNYDNLYADWIKRGTQIILLERKLKRKGLHENILNIGQDDVLAC